MAFMKRMLLIVLGLCSLSACMHVTKPMTISEKPTEEMGYLYGKFKLSDSSPDMDIVLILVNVDSEIAKKKDRYGKSTVKKLGLRFDKKQDIYSIAVEPGTYRLNGLEYGTNGNLQRQNNSISDAAGLMSREFKVEAGKAYYLGDWYGSGNITSSYPMTYYNWKLDKITFDYDGTSSAFLEQYKSFGSVQRLPAFHLDYSDGFDRNKPETYDLGNLRLAVSYADTDLAVRMATQLQDKEPDARAYLGYFYEKGIGVEKNFSKAIDLYKKSVEEKSPLGMWTMGVLFYDLSKLQSSDPEQQKKFTDRAYDLIQAAAFFGNPKAVALQCAVFTGEKSSINTRVLGEAWCNIGKKMLNQQNQSDFEESPIVKGYEKSAVRADQAKVAELQQKIETVMAKNKVVLMK